MSTVSPYRRRVVGGSGTAAGAGAAPPFYQSAYVRLQTKALHFVDDKSREYYRITREAFPEEWARYGDRPDTYIVVVPRGSTARGTTRGLPDYVDFPQPGEVLPGNLMETVAFSVAPASLVDAIDALRQHTLVTQLATTTAGVLVKLLKSASVRGDPPTFNPTAQTRRRLLRTLKKLLRVCIKARDAASVYLLRGAVLRVQNVFVITNAKRVAFMRKMLRRLTADDEDWLRRTRDSDETFLPTTSHRRQVGERAQAQCKDVLRVPDNLVGIARLEFV